MPTPTTPVVTQSPDLNTLFELQYSVLESQFIGSSILPTMTVPVQSGSFGRITLESLLEHSTDTRRAPTSGYKRRQYEFTTESFQTQEYGIEEVMDDREVKIYGNYINAQPIAVGRAVNTILTGMEQRIANQVMDTAYYLANAAQSQVIPTLWSDPTSDPIADVEAAIRKVRDATGYEPNVLLLSYYTFRTLRTHPKIVDQIDSSGAGDQRRTRDVTTAQLAAVFDIDRVAVGGGMYNSSNPNAAANLQDIWPDQAMVLRSATTGDIQEPCLGRVMHWAMDGSTVNGTIESYEEVQNRSSIVRCRHETEEKILYREMSCMLYEGAGNGVIAP